MTYLQTAVSRPSDICKAHGLASLAELVALAPWPKQTLLDMARRHPERFLWVVRAAVVAKSLR